MSMFGGSVLFDQHDKSANAPSATQQGAQYGMQVGSLFGPVGMAVGAAAGGIIGAASGNGARDRARRAATNQSYEFVGQVYKYTGQTRKQIDREYQQNVSLLNARVAGSGASMDENRMHQKGRVMQARDRAYEKLDAEVAAYREGPNYDWFRKDYNRLGDVSVMTRGSAKNNDYSVEYKFGGFETRSSKDSRAYNERQLRMMPSYATKSGTDQLTPSDRANVRLMEEYSARVKPSMAMYESRVFGGKEGLKKYNEYIEQRIAKANKWYQAERAVLAIQEQQWKKQADKGDQRG